MSKQKSTNNNNIPNPNNSTNTIKNNTNINIPLNKNDNSSKNKSSLKSPLYNKFIPKKIDMHYILICLYILIPLLLIVLIIYLYHRLKKRKKNKKQKENYNINRIHKEKPQIKESYDIIMNSSGINNIMPSNDNLNEIKVQNMKEEMKSIINNTGSSSGRRKREKRKVGKKHKNVNEFTNKEEQKGIQNELKEQIKQFVIEEHNNNINDNNDINENINDNNDNDNNV